MNVRYYYNSRTTEVLGFRAYLDAVTRHPEEALNILPIEPDMIQLANTMWDRMSRQEQVSRHKGSFENFLNWLGSLLILDSRDLPN